MLPDLSLCLEPRFTENGTLVGTWLSLVPWYLILLRVPVLSLLSVPQFNVNGALVIWIVNGTWFEFTLDTLGLPAMAIRAYVRIVIVSFMLAIEKFESTSFLALLP